MVKSLRLGWIGRLLDDTDANWKAIPDYFFQQRRSNFFFLLKCNYDVNLFEANFPLFFPKLLGYFEELRIAYGGEPRKKFRLRPGLNVAFYMRRIELPS